MANFLNNFTDGVADFFGSDLSNILQGGNGVESDYIQFKKNSGGGSTFFDDIPSSTIGIKNNPKLATKSYMNEYAFISYGGQYLANGAVSNMFKGPENNVPTSGLASDHNTWKNPTAKNIIEWSNTLRENQQKPGNIEESTNASQLEAELKAKGITVIDDDFTGPLPPNSVRKSEIFNTDGIGAERKGVETEAAANKAKVNNIDQSSRTGLPPTLGMLTYEWKDFAFCKYFGRIPNNRLITLRRFKLPTLDSGAVIGRDELVDKVKNWGRDSADYLNSDSARALTYFGEKTGNNINNFVGFNFGLNWEVRETDVVDIPGVNSGISGYNPFTKKNIQSSVLGSLDEVARNQMVSSFGLMQQISNAQRTGDINEFDTTLNEGGDNPITLDDPPSAYDLTIQNANEMSPWQTGWQHRIYGPINVITRTYRRGRGLSFTSDTITINFEYDVMQIDTLNHKLAMLDIISNILALTYADATFYGGDFRFLRQPTDIPIPFGLQDQIEQFATGQEVDFSLLGTEYKKLVSGVFSNLGDSLTEFYNKLKIEELEKVGAGLEETLKLMGLIKEKKESSKKTEGKDKDSEAEEQTVDNNAISQANILEKGTDVISTLFNTVNNFVGSLANDGGATNPLKALASGFFGKGYSISSIAEKLTVITPLFTGEPVGEWHLTVGNPMNPFMMIGNLICKSCKIEFNDTLGPDDFPTQLKAQITLQHARERDKGDIESMFNLGQGRFYVNIDGEPEPWNTGFSANDSGNSTGELSDNQKKRKDAKDGGNIPGSPDVVSDNPQSTLDSRVQSQSDAQERKLEEDTEAQINAFLDAENEVRLPEDPIFKNLG